MAKNATSHLTWYHKPFGLRVVSPDYPFFTISQPRDPDDNDGRRRNELAELAGL